MKIQRLAELEAEMRDVARGERHAPADAAAPSFESAEVLLRVLTPEIRRWLQIIRDEKPRSISELAHRVGSPESTAYRTVARLEGLGLLKLERVANRLVPIPAVNKLLVEIDPYAWTDRVEAV